MTPNVYTYIVDLPPTITEMVVPCLDGYTVYLDSKLSYSGRVQAFLHALRHIEADDWSKTDVQEIEQEAHNGHS